MHARLLFGACLAAYLGSGPATAAGLLIARDCKPIQCGRAIVGKLRSLGQGTAACTAVGNGDIAQLGACVSSIANIVDFSTLDGCQSCGNCTNNQFAIAKNYLCGLNGNGRPFGVGPSRCAQLRSSNPTPEDNDYIVGDYVYHCGNHHVFDVTAGLCYFDCLNCNECSTCQGDPDNLKNAPAAKSEDPGVYNQMGNNVIILQSEATAPGSRRDLKGLQTRQAGLNNDDPPDGLYQDSGRFRASNYGATCMHQPHVYLAGYEFLDRQGVPDMRMLLPTPDDTVATNVRDAWNCDHVLELWMIDGFLNANPQYTTLRAQLDPRNPRECSINRLKDILNFGLNLIGVEEAANKLKFRLLNLDPNTDYTNWASEADHVVILLYKYLTDRLVAQFYEYTMGQVANALQSENGGQDLTVANNFRTYATQRYLHAAEQLWNEYYRRRGGAPLPNRARQAAPATTVVMIPSATAAGPSANFLPLGKDQPDTNPNDFDVLTNA